MQAFRTRWLGIAVWASFGLGLAFSTPASVQAQAASPVVSETVLTLDPVQCKVHWTVDSTLHTVHGTFALTRGSVHFDPRTGKAGGEIVVYAPSGESGNTSRDKRMHREILETSKYPEVAFRPLQIEGKVSPSGASDVKLNGVFSIHGTDHDLTAVVHAELSGNRWNGNSKFVVPYVKWGIKDPSNFLLKVNPVVSVELEISGAVEAAN
ncbi:MAG: YceI family protein [Terriglobales bacterium]|jgi:polyisoprenoid-binding protein YceI